MLEIAIKGGITNLAFTILKALLVLISLGYVIKHIGEPEIGFFHYVQAGCAFIYFFTGNTVVSRGIIQFVAENKEAPFSEYRRILGASFGFLIISYLGINGILVLFGYWGFFELNQLNFSIPKLSLYLSTIVAIDFFNRLSILFGAYLTGKQRIVLANALKGAYEFVTPICVLIVAYLHPTLLSYLMTLIIMGLLRTLHFYVVSCQTAGALWLPNIAFTTIPQMPIVTKVAYLGSLADPLHTQVDRLVLGYFGGVSILPVYTMAHRFRELVVFLLDGICRTYFPVLSAEGKNAIAKAQQIDFVQRWFVSIIVFILNLGMILFTPAIISIIVTPDFGERARIFVILASLQSFAYGHSFIPLFGLLALKKMKEVTIFNWLEALLVVFTIFPLLSLLGNVGVAVSRLATIPQTFYANHIYGKFLDFSWRKVLSPIWGSFVLFIIPLSWALYLHYHPPEILYEITIAGIFFTVIVLLRLVLEMNMGKTQEKKQLFSKITRIIVEMINRRRTLK